MKDGNQSFNWTFTGECQAIRGSISSTSLPGMSKTLTTTWRSSEIIRFNPSVARMIIPANAYGLNLPLVFFLLLELTSHSAIAIIRLSSDQICSSQYKALFASCGLENSGYAEILVELCGSRDSLQPIVARSLDRKGVMGEYCRTKLSEAQICAVTGRGGGGSSG